MDAAEIKKLDKAHIMHSWAVNATLDPTVISDVDGVYLIDGNGRKILDFSSQLLCVNVGHKNQKIIKAIQEQAEKVCYVYPGFSYESRVKLGQTLAGVTPGDLEKFFFTLGGAEANDNAIKIARAYTRKHKILARYRSYHGATFGAITLTGDPRRPPVEPGIPGVIHVLDPYCYRCPFGSTYPECGIQCVEHIAEVIQYEIADTVAAVIIEPVTGSNGIIIPPDGYLKRLREICDENNILLIADEVMSGFGRTGQWFAIQNWDVVPDLITMAKGLTSSYIPLGAVAMCREVSSTLDEEMLYCGLTYNAHPLSCAAAKATIEVYREEKLIENARVMGSILKAELERLKEKHACVGDARAIGLFSCLELVKNKRTKEPLSPYNAMGKAAENSTEISKHLMARGLFTFVRWMFLFIAPPLSISEDQLREGLSIIDEVLDYADTLTEK
ncbi:MAG: aminotransferase class III-fold pyridoxal phosphate-dependent enzyme [Syntrophobacterales bacterium]|nr:MAG: aminotransferase class III-fold pyridoxal phosphate-dependent enzyme [Syntrophobacterales bacterium]